MQGVTSTNSIKWWIIYGRRRIGRDGRLRQAFAPTPDYREAMPVCPPHSTALHSHNGKPRAETARSELLVQSQDTEQCALIPSA